MPRALVTVLSLGLFLAPQLAQTQATLPNRSPQALLELAQSLQAAGGVTALAGMQDFSGSGDVTFYWAGKEVQGTARIEARGADEFRFDAYLPNGTRSWAVSKGTGELKDVDGKISTIPPYNALTLGGFTFPYLQLLKANSDNATGVQDLGDVTVQGKSLRKLHVQHSVMTAITADDAVNHLMDADYLFDPQTRLIASVQNKTHPVESMTRDVSHEVQFSDYRNVSGIMVPFSITEYIGGQRIWTLQLSSIEFNTGLDDSEFHF